MNNKISFAELRRIARENVVRILYSYDLSENDPEFCIKTFFDLFYDNIESEEILNYTNKTVYGTISNLKQIDELMEKMSENWTLNRMAIIDKNIIRLAIYEINYIIDIPPIVSVNEAIELGKKFGNIDSKRFINGILDKIVKKSKEKK